MAIDIDLMFILISLYAESLFDTLSHENCEILAGNGLCENDPNPSALCAKTCASSGTPYPEPTLGNF